MLHLGRDADDSSVAISWALASCRHWNPGRGWLSAGDEDRRECRCLRIRYLQRAVTGARLPDCPMGPMGGTGQERTDEVKVKFDRPSVITDQSSHIVSPFSLQARSHNSRRYRGMRGNRQEQDTYTSRRVQQQTVAIIQDGMHAALAGIAWIFLLLSLQSCMD